MPSATEIRVAGDGFIRVATVGTAAPNDTTDVYAAGWTDLGYANEDGVSLTPSLDTDDIMAWQSSVPVRRIVTASSLEVSFTLLQSNITTMGLYFGATTNANGNLEIPVAGSVTERALAVDWIDGTTTSRLLIPRAALTDRGELTLSRGDAVGYELTFTALPPATGPLALVLLAANVT